MIHSIRKGRLQQIRLCARVANGLAWSRPGRSCIQALHDNRAIRTIIDRVLGFHRPFASIGEAQRHIAEYANGGHENTDNVRWHLGSPNAALLSDYPALFHLLGRQDFIKNVFDMGGNAGNLFYRYDRYLHWPATMTWTVYDLEQNIRFGQTYAEERQEQRIRFTTSMDALDGADLLLASGSLHYFENPIELIASVQTKPSFVLVNRTPLTDRDRYAVVQDVGDWMVACAVHNRREIYDGFRKLGYDVLDEWSMPEYQIKVAGSPAMNVSSYSGFFAAMRGAPTGLIAKGLLPRDAANGAARED